MTKLQIIEPPFPTGKAGSFVSSKRQENPILITYMIDPNIKNVLYGDLQFRDGAEGPPGHVHGGCQAAILDEVMGSCCWAHNYTVVARKIDVEFIKMIPIQSTYQVKAQIEKIDGRKIFVSAEILQNNQIFAKSTGIFIVLDENKIQQLKGLM